jgi:nucleoside-diphosphate-sugar epimerase
MNKYIISGITGKVAYDLIHFLKSDNGYIKYDANHNVSAKSFIHLGAISDSNTKDYKKIIDSNILYLKECIDYCIRNSIKNFIFFSVLSIYSHQDKLNIDEVEDYYKCDNLYNLSKLLGEMILKNTTLNVLILRLPSILTTDQNSGIIYKFYKALKENKNIYLTNSNKIFNNFVTVEDIYNFINLYNFKKKYEIVILAKEQYLTLEEILLFMKKELNSHSLIIKQKQKRPFFNISIKKASKLGYRPEKVELSLKKWIEKRR